MEVEETLLFATSFLKNYFSFWYKQTFTWQGDLVLIQSDVEFIKSSKYITDWILSLIFEVGVSSSSRKDPIWLCSMYFAIPNASRHFQNTQYTPIKYLDNMSRVQTNFKNSAEYRILAEIRLPFQPNRTQFSKIRFRFNRNRNTGKKFGFNRILTEFFITGIAVSCRKGPDMQA